MATNYGTVIPLNGVASYFDSKKGISDALGIADPLIARNSAFIDSASYSLLFKSKLFSDI